MIQDTKHVVEVDLAASMLDTTVAISAALGTTTMDTQNTLGSAVHIQFTSDQEGSVATVHLRHSDVDEDTEFVDCTFDEVSGDVDGDLNVVLTGLEDRNEIGYTGLKRYVKALATIVGYDSDGEATSTIMSINMINVKRPQYSESNMAIPGSDIVE